MLLPEEPEGFLIGMLSELHPTKRVEDAIEAMSLVRVTHPEARLVVLGGGEQRLVLEALIRERGLETRVILAGFVPDASLYLQAFNLFLHASRSEALGFVILEAGCASLPVVATQVGGIPEIITDEKSGLLVPSYRPDRMGKAVVSLMEHPLRAASLGAALHTEVVTDFSMEQMIEKTFALY